MLKLSMNYFKIGNMEEKTGLPLKQSNKAKRVFNLILMSVTFFGLYITSRYNYLLYHSLAEIFSITIAGFIFIIAWNSKEYLKSGFFIFLGIAYLYVGGLDLLHTLAYQGMNVFQGDTDYAPQLWIVARFIESLSILAAFIFLKVKKAMRLYLIKAVYFIVVSLAVLSIFYLKIFPICLIEGKGLTPFKKISEYAICLILLVAIFLLFKFKDKFDKEIFRLLLWSFVFTIGSELAFTLYITSYGLANLIGHYFKIISYYLIYKAIIEIGIRKPYNLIFRELKRNEEMLEKLARTDTLTGLLNRRAFFGIFEYERSKSSRKNNELSIIMGDIDHFKEKNDKYGHDMGDYILKTTAEIFKNNLRKQDSICRWGGEEFVILLPEVCLQAAITVAEKLRKKIESHDFVFTDISIQVTMSFGVSRFDPQKNFDENLKITDKYLYRSKENGRNQVSFGMQN